MPRRFIVFFLCASLLQGNALIQRAPRSFRGAAPDVIQAEAFEPAAIFWRNSFVHRWLLTFNAALQKASHMAVCGAGPHQAIYDVLAGVGAGKASAGDQFLRDLIGGADRAWESLSFQAITCFARTRHVTDDMAEEYFHRAYPRISARLAETGNRVRSPVAIALVAMRWELLMDLRSQRSHPNVPISEEHRVAKNPEGAYLLAHMIRTAMGGLTETASTILKLRLYQGLSYQEIASRLGQKTGTVSSRLSRALEMLKKILEEPNGGDLAAARSSTTDREMLAKA